MPVPFAPVPDPGLLRFITCGSVDDGKSTLIGRLLYDSTAILADTLDVLAATSRQRGLGTLDLSLLTDGLQAEREQGITIDVGYRYFSTGTRKYILGDAPGHEQYTRNMVTAASTADLAVLLVDARKGVLTQTRRHSAIARLLGVRNLVVAVNKMDLVGWSKEVFEAIRGDYLSVAGALGIRFPRFVPISALLGDGVVARGGNLDWYEGPTLLELLETADPAREDDQLPFRFPVQWVCRPRPGAEGGRGFAGRVAAGRVRTGEALTVLPSGAAVRVKVIHSGGAVLAEARAGQSVTLVLHEDIDISRGDLLAGETHHPRLSRDLEATLCWFGETPARSGCRYLLSSGPWQTRAFLRTIHGRLDLHALQAGPTAWLALNDIGQVSLRLQDPIAADRYRDIPATGGFILIDETSNATVAGGMIDALA